MKRLLLLTLLALCLAGVDARAQFGSFGDVPIDITADESRFESGIAVAEGSVIIRYGDTVIYCDFAQYNPDTRDVLVSGSVRLYRAGQQFTGDRAVYNLETKQLTAADFRGQFTPFQFSGESLSTLGSNAYQVRNGIFTTSDNSKPDWHIRARNVRIYPDDRVIFSNVTLYVGRTPIFFFPYVYQSLNKEQSFSILPGYNSVWGAHLLTRYTFPLSSTWSGSVRLDLLSERGVGLGFESEWEGGKTKGNWGRFQSYVISDSNPELDKTRAGREGVSSSRYRISLQDRTYFTEDIYSTLDINKLSDPRFLQDFEFGEFRRNPNPDNLVALTKWDENYTATFLARGQLNEFFDTTERLPEVSLDIKRQPFFGAGVFYEGESSAGFYRRNFGNLADTFPDYESLRVDTFHQWTLPKTFFGFLAVVPRFGLRATYYGNSGGTDTLISEREQEDVLEDGTVQSRTVTTRERIMREGGSIFRPVINGGVESSFKISKAYEQVQSRRWGLDGLRHVIQPYTNLSLVYSSEDGSDVLQFDRINPSTQLPPIDFPQFNAIDSIDSWAIHRFGVRNRLQTRRDNLTYNWLEIDTFFDVNYLRPDFTGEQIGDPGTFSNLYTRLRWAPVPWAALSIDAQVPIFDEGFTEINTTANFTATKFLQLSIGHRFIEGNPQFFDSNLLTFGGYYQVTDDWGLSVREQFEVSDGVLESQRYELHRDLSSWVASLGFVVRDNRGVDDYGVLLTFTLKDLPSVRLPFALDPQGFAGQGSGKSR